MAKLKPFITHFAGETIEIPVSVNTKGVFMGKIPDEITSLVGNAASDTCAATLDECHAKITEIIELARQTQIPEIADWIYYLYFKRTDGNKCHGMMLSINAVVVREVKWGKKTAYEVLAERPIVNGMRIEHTNGIPIPIGFYQTNARPSDIKANGVDSWNAQSGHDFGKMIQGWAGEKPNRIPYTEQNWASMKALVSNMDDLYHRIKKMVGTPELLLAAMAQGQLLLQAPATK